MELEKLNKAMEVWRALKQLWEDEEEHYKKELTKIDQAFRGWDGIAPDDATFLEVAKEIYVRAFPDASSYDWVMVAPKLILSNKDDYPRLMTLYRAIKEKQIMEAELKRGKELK